MESGGSQSCPGGCVAFVRTHKGLVLLGEIVLCVLTLVCYGASRTPGYTGVAVCELVFAAAFLVLYACGLHRRLALVHWGWSVSSRPGGRGGGLCLRPPPPQDFIRCLIGCLLFLITSLIVLIGHRDGSGIAAGVSGGASGSSGRSRDPRGRCCPAR